MGTLETGDLGNVENASREGDETSSTPEVKDRSDDEGRARTEFEVAELAKTLTGQSTWSNVPDNPFGGEKDSALDPNSPNFRARQWVKSMVKLQQADNKNPGRTAGIAFQDLNVHGFGEATDYQKDVGNVWLELIGYGKRLLGIGKRPRRIEILRDFEGIVESGEMLVVLGPPGSGCSSFLKTITGETHGFVVDDNSYLNYQGIRATQMQKYFRGEAIYTAEGQCSAYNPRLRPRDVHDRV
jgi:ATP-binding cassette, subfamily G (WHITE), member 2, PDR